jgi:hypothetical protein
MSKFTIHGQVHFGWASLNVAMKRQYQRPYISATLTGYAYETIPNKPIIAGKTHGVDDFAVRPASLGALAAGATAVSTGGTTKEPANEMPDN